MKVNQPSVADVPVVVAGTGNLAHHLPALLQQAGMRISYWTGRDKSAVAEMARMSNAEALPEWLPTGLGKPHLVFLAVSDTAIPVLAQPWVEAGHIVVHCSGSVSSAAVGEQGGVLYPLQTFSDKSNPDITNIPFFITAKNDATRRLLVNIAEHISGKAQVVDDEQRKFLHLSAVIVNNFTNHLVYLADQLLHQKGLDYRVLLPLMQETVQKLSQIAPDAAQTGPARRADHGVIESHLALLKNYPELRDVYTLLTNSILRKESEP